MKLRGPRSSTAKAPELTAEKILAELACGRSGCICSGVKTRSTHCPAHVDRRPSLGIDDKGGRVLVICRAGCSQDEVIAALRTRGLWGTPPMPGRERSPAEEALALARAIRTRLSPWLARYRDADEDRFVSQTIVRARQVATALGDCDAAWALLEAAAELERRLLNETDLPAVG